MLGFFIAIPGGIVAAGMIMAATDNWGWAIVAMLACLGIAYIIEQESGE